MTIFIELKTNIRIYFIEIYVNAIKLYFFKKQRNSGRWLCVGRGGEWDGDYMVR